MNNLYKKCAIIVFPLMFFVMTIHAQEASHFSNLEFIENKGQWNSQITFRGDMSNGSFFLTKSGFTILQYHEDDLIGMSEMIHGHKDSSVTSTRPVRPTRNGSKSTIPPPSSGTRDSIMVRTHAYQMDFVGANAAVLTVPEKKEEGYANYFIGDDPSKWAENCGIYTVVTYKNIYPGIDVKYYTESGSLKYEFIVSPGADPRQILMQFKGVDKLSVRNKELVISTSIGDFKELSPYTYQADINGRKKIDCNYKLEKNNTVRFAIGDYDPDQVLIIDPTLVFASLSGSTADNWGYTATNGPDGSFFAGGIVFTSGYPVSPGAYQTNFAGSGTDSWDIGIMRLSANGSNRLYATYLGGSGKDQPHSMFSDPQGNLVIAGRSASPNFPGFAGSSFGTMGGEDIIVAKLSANGSQLLGSVRVGGSANDGFNSRDSHSGGPFELVNNYGDDARSEVILDAAGNIYLASCTQSGNFYVSSGATQSTLSGGQDAVLIKIDPTCRNVLHSTYLGGSGYDAGFVLALNPSNGDVYVSGATSSSNFPGNKTGVIMPSFQGGRTDGFIAVYSNNLTVLKQSTYIGTNGVDFIFGIQFDRNSFPYVMGTTSGRWDPVNAAWSNPGSKQFVGKLRKDLSAWEFTTVFGSPNSTTPNISPVAFLVDRCENLYVSGWGKGFANEFPLSGTAGMSVTPDAIKRTTDNSDLYFIVIEKNASSLLYGTFFGQTGGLGEHVDGGTSRFDENGVIYQAICANCGSAGAKPRWPVTPGAWCCSSGYAPVSGSGCNLGALKIYFNYAGVGSKVKPYITGSSTVDSTGCVPASFTFRDTIRNARSYEWNFGDGSPELFNTSFEVNHTYTSVGNFRVRLIAVDSSSCNIRDTSYVTVSVRDNRANLAFTFTKADCLSLEYTFVNESQAASRPFSTNSFIWDFGDGTRTGPYGVNNITHTYSSAGSYRVRLILRDTAYCNAPDSLEVLVRASPLVRAQFEIPSSGCAPFNAVFNNTSVGGQTFSWDFGDGTTSTEINPVHLYSSPGIYTIRLVAVDSLTCNIVHDTTMQIELKQAPVAAFTYTPVAPVENTPNIFTNTSSPDATRFLWQFGDGDSLVTTSRSPVEHQYNESFTFNACLIAYNDFGCSDTICEPVTTIVVPRLDVPNAFTPLGNKQAGVVYVRGFAIGKMRFVIYNRLGQKVFESTDVSRGWDGTFKGVVQPMDVYAYTLEVQFTDGTSATKKGDITLIR